MDEVVCVRETKGLTTQVSMFINRMSVKDKKSFCVNEKPSLCVLIRFIRLSRIVELGIWDYPVCKSVHYAMTGQVLNGRCE